MTVTKSFASLSNFISKPGQSYFTQNAENIYRCLSAMPMPFSGAKIKFYFFETKWRPRSCAGYRHVVGIVMWWVSSCGGYRHVVGIVMWWVSSCGGRLCVSWANYSLKNCIRSSTLNFCHLFYELTPCLIFSKGQKCRHFLMFDIALSRFINRLFSLR